MSEFDTQLEQIYLDSGYGSDFDSERGVYEYVLPRLAGKLDPLKIERPIACGSTATIWQVHDESLNLKRALKFPRPRLARLGKILRVLLAEREQLSALNHQNVVKVYLASELDEIELDGSTYSFPYFLMDFIDDVKDFDVYLLQHWDTLAPDQAIAYFRDAVAGVDYLHKQNVFHCDLKPGNMFIAPTSPTLIGDLGYSKKPFSFYAPDGATEVTYTPRYAHPRLRERMERSTDENANVAVIDRSELEASFDLYSLGRSFREVLQKIAVADRSAILAGTRLDSLFTPYQWRYMCLIAVRLLDGQVETISEEPLASDILAGMPKERMDEFKYISAEEALEDFDRLLNLFDLEGQIPELSPNLRTYIQVPGIQVPLTRRVQSLIDHPLLARLSSVTQLGFVNLVYPGATHTRFEHVLGTFAQCCETVRALWHDEENCFFRSVMRKEDINSLLAASLLHDIAQYPMGHDLAEVVSDFDHDRFTESLLMKGIYPTGTSIADVLNEQWGLSIEAVTDVLNAHSRSSVRSRILRSILNGPLDCDKMDYLLRDSIHSGVAFAKRIDLERLRKNLTVVWTAPSPNEFVIEIGILEKALAVAEDLGRSRQNMFQQVYWQHSIRSVKAMLAYVVRNIAIRGNGKPPEGLLEFIINPLEHMRAIREPSDDSSDSSDSPMSPEWLRVQSDPIHVAASHLHPSDEATLGLLGIHARGGETHLLDMIRERALYKRLVVLASDGTNETHHGELYEWFRQLRLNGYHDKIEQQRKQWEEEVVAVLSGAGDRIRDAIAGITDRDVPILLVDIPVKALRRGGVSEAIWFLPEERTRPRGSEPAPFPGPQRSHIDVEGPSFDKRVGKIRVLLHPEIYERARDVLAETETDIMEKLQVD